MSKLKELGGKYEGRRKNDRIPDGHMEIVNITTDGDRNLSINFNIPLVQFAEKRHLDIILAALEDAFYRMRPDLRKQ